MRNEISNVLYKAAAREELNREEITKLLSVMPGEEEQALFALADKIRREVFGDAVHLRGLIEFSNYCNKDCYYCGLRCSNNKLERYRLSMDEILWSTEYAAKLGYGTVVLQSGEDPYFNGERLAEIVYKVKQTADLAVTMSAGVLSEAEYKMLKQAGADRYLMKHETADAALFARLRPGTTLENRIENLLLLGRLGFQVGSGFMIGLPGQDVSAIADDILLLKKVKVQMAGIGPFVPHSETPFHDCAAGRVADTLRAVAVTRIVLPKVHLPATTALGTLDPYGQRHALAAGANVVMPNLSPTEYRKLYQIYPGKKGSDENPVASHERIANMLSDIGRTIAKGRGDGLGVNE